MSLHVAGAGSSGHYKGRPPTLATLEAEIAYARSQGAPDDARVVGTGGVKSGSVYLLEVIWTDPKLSDPRDRM